MLNDAEKKSLLKAQGFWEAQKPDDAWDIVRKLLMEHPFEPPLLQMAGHIYELAGNVPVSYHFFRQATEQEPREGSGWVNFGRMAEELWRSDEAERAYHKALKYSNREETTRCTYGNLAALCIDNARYAEAEDWSRKALERWPGDEGSLSNLGFALLGQRRWDEAWPYYRHCLGLKSRTRINYRGEPDWDGTPGQTVVLYGEQGLGDEISFASMVPDALKHCKKVIIDCDVRLANLFQRSFPQARVYGTRKVKPFSEKPLKWNKEDRDFDASLAIGQIGEYYRTSAESFPGTPYLVADPERVLMWKALWASKGKPVIGIAWQGGIPKTGAKFRKWTLEQLLPVLRSVDAHWVCLEYKAAAGEIETFRAKYPDVDIREYANGTLTTDYDDTAALVASLDHVFCIQTSIAHLCGALGVPCWVCVPPSSQWRYGGESDTVPWYDCLKVIRQVKGEWRLDDIGQRLGAHFGILPAAAARVA